MSLYIGEDKIGKVIVGSTEEPDGDNLSYGGSSIVGTAIVGTAVVGSDGAIVGAAIVGTVQI